MSNRQITEGDTVQVHYTGRLDDGQVFDTSRQREPLSFTVGQGQLIPGFEAGIMGLAVGETRTVRIEPDNGYGDRRDDLVVQVARESAPEGIAPEDRVRIADRPAVVTEVTDEHVTADLNHPLAGETLTFEVEVVDIAA